VSPVGIIHILLSLAKTIRVLCVKILMRRSAMQSRMNLVRSFENFSSASLCFYSEAVSSWTPRPLPRPERSARNFFCRRWVSVPEKIQIGLFSSENCSFSRRVVSRVLGNESPLYISRSFPPAMLLCNSSVFRQPRAVLQIFLEREGAI